LLDRLGGIPAYRVLLSPPPGQAVEADVLELDAREDRLSELVEGTLVEKDYDFRASVLTVALASHLINSADRKDRGVVTGSDAPFRLAEGLIRLPDAAFTSWNRLPGGRIPQEPIADFAPDLAVEVLSAGNTDREMERKRKEYFEAGVRIVWVVDLEDRAVAVIKADGSKTVLDTTKTLDGGDVLPGFALSLRDLFAELDAEG
jgi:Uma2 family endonuclease